METLDTSSWKDISSATTMARLSHEEFNHLSALIYKECGINLSFAKKVMLESRLNKRLRALRISTFKEYIDILEHRGQGTFSEMIHMIDVVTTNKTDFFREPHHFTFLQEHILKEFTSKRYLFKIWSAACSSGEEPYTLAIVLAEFARLHENFDFTVFGSDISMSILQAAVLGIYSSERVQTIPDELKRRYLLKSKDTANSTVRIVPELRQKVRFDRVNFMDSIFSIKDDYDVIFCRNVLIYFERKVQMEVIGKLLHNLRPGGYLFIGHSESLFQQTFPIVQIKPTIYKKLE